MTQPDSTFHSTPPPSTPPASRPPSSPRPRFRLYFLLGLLVATLLLAWAVSWLTHPQHLAQLIARQLERRLRLPVRLAYAYWSPTQPLLLENLEIFPRNSLSTPPLLRISYVLVDLNPASLLLGRLHIYRLTLIQPTLELSPHLLHYHPTFLAQPRAPYAPSPLPPFTRFTPPSEILLADARLQPPSPSSPPLRFHLLAQRDSSSPTQASYQLVFLHQPSSHASAPLATPIRLRGSVSFQPLDLQLHLANLSIDQHLRPLFAPLFPWWQQFDPAGTIRQASLRWDPIHTWQWDCSLENLALTVPRHDLPSGFRLTAQTARLRFVNPSLHIDALAGRLFDVDYSLHGQISHLSFTPSVDLSIQAAGPFPTDPDVIALLPPLTRHYLQRFQPQGPFQLQLRLTGVLGKEKLTPSGHLSLQDVQASDAEHPCPLHHLHGEIRFDHESVAFDLSGQTFTQAPVRIHGRIWQPTTADAAVDLNILAHNLLLDSQLLACLPPEHRRLVESFLAQPAQPDPPANPLHFIPGGTFDLQLHLQRPFGSNQSWQTEAEIQPRLLHLAWHTWPYPLIADAGRILIHRYAVEFDQLHLRGPHGGELTVTGSVQTLPRSTCFDLSIAVHQLPLDPLFSASLDPTHRRWLAWINPQGSLTGAVRINGLSPSWRILLNAHSIQIHLQNTTLPLLLTAGTVTIEPEKVFLQGIQAKPLNDSSDCLLHIDGVIRQTNSQPSFELRATARYLPLHTLLELIPSDIAPQRQLLHRLLHEYPLSGRTHAHLDWSSSPTRPPRWLLQLQPLDLTLSSDPQPLTLRFTSGQIRIDPQIISFDNLSAEFPSGRAYLAGTLIPSDQPSASLSLQAELQSIDHRLFSLLPTSLAHTLQSLQLTGSCRIDPLELHYQHSRTSGSPLWNLAAHLDLSDLALKHPFTIENLTGRLDLRWSSHPSPNEPSLQLNLSADQLRFDKHLIRHLQAELSQSQVLSSSTQEWQLSRLTGDFAGGKLLASGIISLNNPAFYRLSLILENADLETFLRRPPATASDPATPARLSARLDIEAPLLNSSAPSASSPSSPPPTRRGRGQVRILGPRLYQMPLAMALVQVLNLAWPTFRPFDRVDVHFFLQNDLAHLERLSFQAPRLEITGAGTLDLSDWSLDLDLFARNPAAARLGPLSEALDLIRDELVSIKVRGTLAEPRARLQTLAGTRRSWNEIFNP